MLIHPASYRDNCGFVFSYNGSIYRYVHPVYEKHYAMLMQSGLYEELVTAGKLIAHSETAGIAEFGFSRGRVLLPQQLPFISYPYEWSFDMWKDAALLTLQISTAALQKGMLLKDATPFNIQFVTGRPLFIDTLSFECCEEGRPWVAYRQFCECFLGPLLLMHYCHPETGRLFSVYPNGIPIDLLVKLLPTRSKWNINTFLHIHLQARFRGRKKSVGAGRQKSGNEYQFSRRKLELLLKGLEGFVLKLSPQKIKTTWDDYYTDTILNSEYLNAKTTLVNSFLRFIDFKTVIDLGANDGHFSLLFGRDTQVVATDADANCINELYLKIKSRGIPNILPLVNELTTPSPAIGWNNTERESFTNRLKADLVLALALVHHLAIANNVPLPMLADWLRPMGEYLLIEYVPKTDEKVKLLLQNRMDIFDRYSLDDFKAAFDRAFEILKEEKIGRTGRILFLMKRR